MPVHTTKIFKSHSLADDEDGEFAVGDGDGVAFGVDDGDAATANAAVATRSAPLRDA